MGLTREVHVRLGSQLFLELHAYADANGLSRGAAMRMLLSRALHTEPGQGTAPADQLGLAALVAAEHAVLMVVSILPEGEQRMRSLASRASQAAEERLAFVRELVASEESAR
jgi:hypothetical protein